MRGQEHPRVRHRQGHQGSEEAGVWSLRHRCYHTQQVIFKSEIVIQSISRFEAINSDYYYMIS